MDHNEKTPPDRESERGSKSVLGRTEVTNQSYEKTDTLNPADLQENSSSSGRENTPFDFEPGSTDCVDLERIVTISRSPVFPTTGHRDFVRQCLSTISEGSPLSPAQRDRLKWLHSIINDVEATHVA